MANNLGIPGLTMGMDALSSMFDMDFVKKAWGTLSLPSNFAPTIDVGELDKRIADLRAVEQWLNLNLGMLRGSIQALEIQRGTIAAVKAFGNVAAAAGQGAGDLAATLASMSAAPAEPAPAAPKFAGFERPPRTGEPAGPEPQPDAVPESEPEPEPKPRPIRARAGAARSKDKPATTVPSGIDGALSPGAWWNLLQSQFNQVAQAAMTGVGLGAPMPAKAGAAAAGPVVAKAPAAKARRKAKKPSRGARAAKRPSP